MCMSESSYEGLSLYAWVCVHLSYGMKERWCMCLSESWYEGLHGLCLSESQYEGLYAWVCVHLSHGMNDYMYGYVSV